MCLASPIDVYTHSLFIVLSLLIYGGQKLILASNFLNCQLLAKLKS